MNGVKEGRRKKETANRTYYTLLYAAQWTGTESNRKSESGFSSEDESGNFADVKARRSGSSVTSTTEQKVCMVQYARRFQKAGYTRLT